MKDEKVQTLLWFEVMIGGIGPRSVMKRSSESVLQPFDYATFGCSIVSLLHSM